MSNSAGNRSTPPTPGRGAISPRALSVSRGASANLRTTLSGDGLQVSKVTGKSLQASLQEGFIELVDALDTVEATLANKQGGMDDPTTLKYKTKHLLQTKGTQAVYWMQLMREICSFTTTSIAQKAAALRAQVRALNANGEPGQRQKEAPAPLPQIDSSFSNFYATIRLLFDSVRDGVLELSGLRNAIEKFVVARDEAWESQMAKLHVHYGQVIDDLRFKFYKAVEEAEMKSGGAPGPALHLGGFDVNEALDKLEQGDEETFGNMHGSERVEQKERYLATTDLLKVIIPPKLATIDLPDLPTGPENALETNQDARGRWFGGSREDVNTWKLQNLGKRKDVTHRFHFALPQAEVAIPAHVIDRYAREVLYKNHEIVQAEELAKLRGESAREPRISLQITPATGGLGEVEKEQERIKSDPATQESPERATEDATISKKESTSKKDNKETGDKGSGDRKKSVKKSSSTRPTTNRTLLPPAAATKPGSRRTASILGSAKARRVTPKTTTVRAPVR